MALHTYGNNEELDSQISTFNKTEKCFRIYQNGKIVEEFYAFDVEEAKAKTDVKGEFEIRRFFQGVEYPVE